MSRAYRITKPPEADVMDQQQTDVTLWMSFAAAVTAVWSFISGRSETRVKRLALEAVDESKRYVPAASQNVLNDQLQDDVREIKETVTATNQKIDAFLLSAKIHIRKRDDE